MSKKIILPLLVFLSMPLLGSADISVADLNSQAREALISRDFPEALELIDQALSQSPQNAVLHYNRGLVRALNGDRFGALDDFNTVIFSLWDDDARARSFYYRGHLKVAWGRLMDAVADYTRCLAIDPDFAPAFEARSDTLLSLSKEDLARFHEIKSVSELSDETKKKPEVQSTSGS